MQSDNDRQNWTSFILALATLALVAFALWGPRGFGGSGSAVPEPTEDAGAGVRQHLVVPSSVPRAPTEAPTMEPPEAEPVTPTPTVSLTIMPEPTIWYPTLAPSPVVVVPTVAPAAPVFAGSAEQWRPLVAEVFPAFAVDTVLRIMECESGGDPNATGRAGERGLLQIHPVHPDSTYDPLGNIRAAYRISAGGQNFGAWTCR